MTINVKVEGLEELAANLSDRQEIRVARVKTLLEATQLLEDAAKRLAPEKTGKSRLRKRIRGYVSSTGNSAYVVSRAPHSHLIEYGTKAHMITTGKANKRGKVKRALLLPGGIMRKSAHHPGSQAEPFMHPALDENMDRIDRILEQHGNDLMVRIAREK